MSALTPGEGFHFERFCHLRSSGQNPASAVPLDELPAGFSFSPKDQGGNDTLDSDVNTGTGRTDQFAIALGQTDTTRDAGMFGVGAGPFTFQGSGFAIPDGVSLRSLSIGGLPGTITDVKVIVTGLSHTDPDDLDFLLVGPNGTANLEFWSDAGGLTDLSGATITVADSGAAALPDAGPLVSGTTYKPADYSTVETDANFTASTGGINHPASNGSATFASAFTNLSANGTWKLYVADDTPSDTGSATGWNLVITVLVLPTTATVGGNQTICSGSTTAGLGGNTPSVGTGTWTVRSGGTGTFNPNAGTPNATFTHTSGAGPVVLRWTIANPPAPDSFAELTVTIASPPATPTITPTPSSVCANSTGNQASGPAGATTYSWTISNGAITSATNIQTITYTAGASGNVGLTLRVSNASGCRATNSLNVAINALPATPTITPTPSSVIANSSGNQASGPAGATTYSWTISNGAITSATNIQTITYTAGASGNVGLTLRVSNAGGCLATNSANVPIVILDFGDSPAPYPTLLVNDGARHLIPGGGATLYFSAVAPDAETDGQPHATALGDDNAGTDDEGGVTLPTAFRGGLSSNVTVNVTGSGGLLNAWIDWNRDGDWSDAGEQIATNLAMSAGANVVSVPVPATAPSGGSFARFRLGTQPGLLPTGQASNGEVEDYAVTLVANTAPVAVNDAVGTLQNRPVSMAATKLTFNDTDADGDALAVTAVSATSTNGGSVVLSSGMITYTPLPALAGQDRFTYTVSDGRGGTAQGTVVVTVDSTNNLSANVVFGPVIEGMEFVVRFAGYPGEEYTIESADTLTSPVPWQKKVNKIAPTDNTAGFGIGVFEFRENKGAATQRFYRTVHPAY